MRAAARAALVGLLALVVVALPAPAGAEGPRLQVRLDGQGWTSAPAHPLLNATGLLPGESRTAEFGVRNGSGVVAAVLTPDAASACTSTQRCWGEVLSLVVERRLPAGGAVEWREVWRDGREAARAPEGLLRLAPGDEARYRVRLELDPALTDQSWAASPIGLRIVLVLDEDAARVVVPPGEVDPPETGTGGGPGTVGEPGTGGGPGTGEPPGGSEPGLPPGGAEPGLPPGGAEPGGGPAAPVPAGGVSPVALPFTGDAAGVLLGAAAALLAGGVALVLLGRRRRA